MAFLDFDLLLSKLSLFWAPRSELTEPLECPDVSKRLFDWPARSDLSELLDWPDTSKLRLLTGLFDWAARSDLTGSFD